MRAGFHPAPQTKLHSKPTYTRSSLIRRRNTSRKAARKASVEARRVVPSDCAVWVRSRRTKDGDTAFSRFVLPTARLPFVARNELAIATKSIASVLSPRYAVAVGSLSRGNGDMGATRKTTRPVDEL